MTAVLLTGATGRVGARFIPLLRARGLRLRLAVWNPAGGPAGGNRDLVVGDLTDPDTCRRAVEGMDAVVHIASAFTGIDAREADRLNHLATDRLAAAALAAGARRFVQLSSYLIYRPTPGRATREDDPLRDPAGAPFPAAKLGAERAVAGYFDTPLGVCVLRVAYTYGEGDPHLVDAFAWARRAPGKQRLHLVHHADVRQSVLHALAAGATGVFNIADDAPVTAAELAALAEQVRLPHGESADAPVLDTDQFGGEVDTSAARAGLGFTPAYPSIHVAAQAGAA
ncbi:NAD-dependent epimerase/dehydratase family protein [Micromonospora echinaurantiaca]|uniref:NAD-dependent epimerase/dehydratase family protein n=1 Tax=Micromonospora echinaurantiaca TaxID=47857 RepID=UPI0037A8B8ED